MQMMRLNKKPCQGKLVSFLTICVSIKIGNLDIRINAVNNFSNPFVLTYFFYRFISSHLLLNDPKNMIKAPWLISPHKTIKQKMMHPEIIVH
jgi:hypothetical protein